LKQGKEEGLKQGKEEGKKEKAKEMARNMLKERLDINLIAKISGLTIEEIKTLTNWYSSITSLFRYYLWQLKNIIYISQNACIFFFFFVYMKTYFDITHV